VGKRILFLYRPGINVWTVLVSPTFSDIRPTAVSHFSQGLLHNEFAKYAGLALQENQRNAKPETVLNLQTLKKVKMADRSVGGVTH
jgi:hypothetical protein